MQVHCNTRQTFQCKRRDILNGKNAHSLHHCSQLGREQRQSALQATKASSGPSILYYMAETEQKVSFTNVRGQRLVGILHPATLKDTVILGHGYEDHKNGFHLPALAGSLAAEGVSSLRIDFNGCNESEGPFKYANHKDEAEDIDAAVQYLKKVGRPAVGLLGHSKAGTSVLLYAATFGQVPKVVNCSGRFDHRRGTEERFGQDIEQRLQREGGLDMIAKTSYGNINWKFNKEAYDERMSMDMDDVCSRIGDATEVLTIHGAKDAVIPVQDAREFAQRLKGNKLIIIEEADHNYSQQPHSKELIRAVTGFLTGN